MPPRSATWPPCLLALALVVAGCAHLFDRPRAPYVNVADLRPVSIGLLEQRYRLQLRVQNPNDVALRIRGMSYTLELNGRDFARGVHAGPLTVPAFGEEVLAVDVVSSLARVVDQFRGLSGGETRALEYRLSGEVSLEGMALRLPFEHAGALDLSP